MTIVLCTMLYTALFFPIQVSFFGGLGSRIQNVTALLIRKSSKFCRIGTVKLTKKLPGKSNSKLLTDKAKHGYYIAKAATHLLPLVQKRRQPWIEILFIYYSHDRRIGMLNPMPARIRRNHVPTQLDWFPSQYRSACKSPVSQSHSPTRTPTPNPWFANRINTNPHRLPHLLHCKI